MGSDCKKAQPTATDPDSIEAGRERLAQLLGRLLAKHWLRERSNEQQQTPDGGAEAQNPSQA